MKKSNRKKKVQRLPVPASPLGTEEPDAFYADELFCPNCGECGNMLSQQTFVIWHCVDNIYAGGSPIKDYETELGSETDIEGQPDWTLFCNSCAATPYESDVWEASMKAWRHKQKT